MYEATIKGKKARLTNRDFESILKRFDVSEFKISPGTDKFVNNERCSLCDKHHKALVCTSCPFGAFKTLDHKEGCMELILGTVKGKIKIMISPKSVVYAYHRRKRAIAQLKLIHKELKAKFKKV